jgi:solute carrier family 10 (sodium/bile acid cotransporter), member 7
VRNKNDTPKLKKIILKNWFILGIVVIIAIGISFPGIGINLNPKNISNNAVIVILFLITGLTLPSEALKSGLKNIKLHLFIQVCIFIITPAFFYLIGNVFSAVFSMPILIGIYALSVLPTTISSCIVFTSSVEGNVVGTMFNAAVANIIGIFISPLLLSLLLRDTYHAIPAEELGLIFKSLILKMFIPIIAGQGLRFFISNLIDKRKKILRVISNVLILLIILFSLSKTAGDPSFTEYLSGLALPFLILALANVVIIGTIFFSTRLFKFSEKDRISAVFAGSQKTMAMGVPLLSAFFAFQPELLGIVLMPLLFYHPWQLLVAAFVKGLIFEKKKEA